MDFVMYLWVRNMYKVLKVVNIVTINEARLATGLVLLSLAAPLRCIPGERGVVRRLVTRVPSARRIHRVLSTPEAGWAAAWLCARAHRHPRRATSDVRHLDAHEPREWLERSASGTESPAHSRLHTAQCLHDPLDQLRKWSCCARPIRSGLRLSASTDHSAPGRFAARSYGAHLFSALSARCRLALDKRVRRQKTPRHLDT